MKSVLLEKRCTACTAATPALSSSEINLLLPEIPGWELRAGQLARTFKFADYYHTMAFVNAVAWMAHREDHHPDLVVGYNRCEVRYSSHAVKGLSENDFICAVKVDALTE
jgi:4a-hydroxytetrahydrobiopterin dehydratase